MERSPVPALWLQRASALSGEPPGPNAQGAPEVGGLLLRLCALVHPPLRTCQVHEMVRTLVVFLDLSIVDLVTAVVLLERCAARRRGLFATAAVRRFFLGCCMVVRKLNCDASSRAKCGSLWRPH